MDITELAPSASVVTELADINHYYCQMCNLWGLEARKPMRNPCALAVSLESHHMNKHSPDEYLVTPKVDGQRFLLLLTRSRAAEFVAIMIARDMKMFEVEVWGPERYFINGTLVDGELAWQGGQPLMTYHVFDAMVIDGTSHVEHALPRRLESINATFMLSEMHSKALERYAASGEDVHLDFVAEEGKIVATCCNPYGLRFVPKSMLPYDEWRRRVTAGHAPFTVDGPTDGLVLTPERLGVYINTHHSMFKWKPREQLTVDIRINNQNIYVRNQGNLLQITEHQSRVVELRTNEELPDGIYECSIELTKETVRVIPCRSRPDKPTPNELKTFDGVVQAFIDNISISTLLAWAQ